MIAALLLFSAAAMPHKCGGFYAFVPRNPRIDPPFSLHVRADRVKKVSFDRLDDFERQFDHRRDGSLEFGGKTASVTYRLRCGPRGATVAIWYSGITAPERYRLIRTRTDIRGVAKAKGWLIGD